MGKNELSPSEVRELRIKAGFSLRQMSELFGYKTVRAWQRKEDSGKAGGGLSFAETQYFLLVTDSHETKKIINK